MALTIVETFTVTGGVTPTPTSMWLLRSTTSAACSVSRVLDNPGRVYPPVGLAAKFRRLRRGRGGRHGQHGAGLTRHLEAAGGGWWRWTALTARTVTAPASLTPSTPRAQPEPPCRKKRTGRPEVATARSKHSRVDGGEALGPGERTRSINQARSLVVTGPDDIGPVSSTLHQALPAELAALRPRTVTWWGTPPASLCASWAGAPSTWPSRIQYLDGLLLR